MNIETLAIHAGQAVDPQTGAVMTPIYQTSTFAQKNPGQDPYMYSRAGNPTRKALEECLAALEGAKHGLAFASGMSATDAALRLLLPGDHVVTSDDVYGGTFRIFTQVYQPYGITFSFVDIGDVEAVRAAIQPNTRIVWIESPSNPKMKIADIRAMTPDQMDDAIANLKKERFNLRFQRATGQLENTSRLREARRDIARIKTVAAQKRAEKK